MTTRKWLIAGALGAASGVLAIRTYQRYRLDTISAHKRVEAGGKLVKTSCGPVEVCLLGSGAPAMIVHGTGGGYDQGVLAAQLVGNGLQLITLSRFGYLRTPLHDNPTPAIQADAFAALLDALKINKTAVIGISGGGPSTLQFALRHPDRCSALVMVSAVSKPVPMAVEVDLDALEYLLSWDLIGWLLVYPLRPLSLGVLGVTPSVWFSLPKDQKAWMVKMIRSMLPLSRKKLGLISDFRQISQMGDLPLENITAPTLVAHAVDDRVVPIEHGHRVYTRVPGARLLELPAGGHLLVGHHVEVSNAVRDFVLAHQE